MIVDVHFKQGVLDKLFKKYGNVTQFSIAMGVSIVTVHYWRKHPNVRVRKFTVDRILKATKLPFDSVFKYKVSEPKEATHAKVQ